jgi:hypothetical protein
MSRSQTSSPSVPRKQQVRRRTFTFGPKNKCITATGNLSRDGQMCKRKDMPEHAR